jgi:UDP-glucose 4-epimerase
MNVACGERTTLLELISALAVLLGREVRPEFSGPRPGDVRHSEAAIDKAARLIGYRPLVTVREGLERTVRWLAERRKPTSAAGGPSGPSGRSLSQAQMTQRVVYGHDSDN